MEDNAQKNQALTNFIQVITEANEMTRNRVSAHDLFLRALFDALSNEQKEKVLTALDFKTSSLSPAAASVSEDSRFELFQLLPELLLRAKLN
ncbi:hypothetical protein H4F33_14575 [Pectobacterium brasiliense]|uniref:hypothetical protein n=1 Tax=Pectobacterium brasiliense TaxID=180957 RepID=UPI0004E66CE1|nr:hypothetical protein [Pectobacterium brasiliense]KFF70309.1 hypothetical protein IW01_10845 [Pectobacterium brasiliense]MBA0216783.1 hypothetical protein [Pectobacterium brasiliense]MBN3073305.1 hypothetical protein [Pectobacterium brasiliense]MBN3169163.1 hypothetical protein [Pectobacterium brasiliense]